MDTGGLIKKLSNFVAPSSEEIAGDLCRQHGRAYLRALHKAAGWAVKMWDSSAKAQTGLMTGNLNSLGNFDECISVINVSNYDTKFSGQHCLATVKVVNISASDVMGKAFQQIMEEEKEINVGLSSLLSKGLRWGFCIPSSCKSEDLEVELSEYIGNTSEVNVTVGNTDCHFDQHNSFSPVDWFAIVIFLTLMLTVIFSTLYESLKAHVYNSVDNEIPPPISSALTEYLRRRLSEILPRRGSEFLQESPSSVTNRRTDSIEIIPYTSDQPTISAQRHDQKYTTMTGHLPGKGKSFWSRGVSATPTPSEAESRASSPLPQVTQRPQYLDLPGTSQAGLNPASQESSHTHSIDSHHPIESEQEQYQALEQREQQVLGKGVSHPLQPHEDITPTTERVEYNSDPWTVFSLISNGKNIFRFEDSSANLQSLYGIKFLSVLWVLIGHAFLVTESLPAMNYVTLKNYTKSWFVMPLLNTSLSADTFIVIAGLLTSYNFLRDMRRRGIYRRNSNSLSRTGLKKEFFSRYLPIYYCHRYVRLTPSLAAIILLQVSLLGHIGSGPFWKSGSHHLSEACSSAWTGTLSYTQNFVNSDDMCPTHSWYLMVDMQLYTISPIILLFLLTWNKKRCIVTLCVLASVGLTASFLVNYLLELPAGFMSGDPSKWQLKFKYDSMATYTRFAPWLVGIGVGYFIHCSRQKDRIELSMKPLAVFLGWILSMVALLFSVFGVFPFQQPDYEYNAVWCSLYSSTYHTIWALGVGWVILACESNHGGFLHTVLSWKIFQPLSRLTFCIYLVHLPLITTRTLMTRVPIYFDGVNALSSVLGDVLFSILLATILSLCVEMPFIRLFKYATIKLGMPVRHWLHQNGDQSEYVPLLRDLEFASYQSITDQPPQTPRQPGSSDEAVKQRGSPVQTAAVSQQTDSDQNKSASSQQGGLPSEESQAHSSVTECTHDDTSGSPPSSTPISEI